MDNAYFQPKTSRRYTVEATGHRVLTAHNTLQAAFAVLQEDIKNNPGDTYLFKSSEELNQDPDFLLERFGDETGFDE